MTTITFGTLFTDLAQFTTTLYPTVNAVFHRASWRSTMIMTHISWRPLFIAAHGPASLTGSAKSLINWFSAPKNDSCSCRPAAYRKFEVINQKAFTELPSRRLSILSQTHARSSRACAQRSSMFIYISRCHMTHVAHSMRSIAWWHVAAQYKIRLSGSRSIDLFIKRLRHWVAKQMCIKRLFKRVRAQWPTTSVLAILNSTRWQAMQLP